jgi:phage tail P2-like protein
VAGRLTHAQAGLFVTACDELLDERVSRMLVPLRDAFDPDRAPVALLPWLAWSMGLTYWSSDWPEAQQRATLREARRIVRERGTRPGIERQLGSLGSSVVISEWWQEDPAGAPGTWKLLVTAPSAETDEQAQDTVEAAVRSSAPLSRPWTIDVGVSGQLPTIGVVHPRITVRVHLTATTATT